MKFYDVDWTKQTRNYLQQLHSFPDQMSKLKKMSALTLVVKFLCFWLILFDNTDFSNGLICINYLLFYSLIVNKWLNLIKKLIQIKK